MRRGVGILLLALVLLATLAFNASPGMAAGEKRILIIQWDRSPYGAGYDPLENELRLWGYQVDVVDKSGLLSYNKVERVLYLSQYDAVIIPDGVVTSPESGVDNDTYKILKEYAAAGGVVLLYVPNIQHSYSGNIQEPPTQQYFYLESNRFIYRLSTWDHFAVGGKEGDLELYNPRINPSDNYASEYYTDWYSFSFPGAYETHKFSWQDNDQERATTIAVRLGSGVLIFTTEKIEVGLTSSAGYDTYWERFVDALLDWSFAYANGAPIDRYASTTTITTTTTLTTTVTTTTTRYTTTTTTMYSTTTVTPMTTVTKTSWTIIPTTVTYTKSQSPIPGGVIILSAILVTLLAWRFRG